MPPCYTYGMITTPRKLIYALTGAVLLGSGVYAVTMLYRAIPRPLPTTTDTGNYAEQAPYYTITAAYATTTPLGGSQGAAAAEVQRDFVQNRIAEFKQNGNFDNLTAEDVHMLGYDEGRKQTLNISYLAASSPATISYVYTIEEYTGGAHGNSDTRTFTFSRSSGKLLSLSDLFVGGAPYLTTLRDAAQAQLAGTLGDFANDTMIADGTSATEGNFSRFFLDDTSLVVIFPPYAVAAYAAGTQTAALPRSSLAELLRPEYR